VHTDGECAYSDESSKGGECTQDGECAYSDESSKGGKCTQMVSVPTVMSLPKVVSAHRW